MITLLFMDSQKGLFVVLGTIDSVEPGKLWWYTACNTCHRKVVEDSDLYYCHTCRRHVVVATKRYRLNVRVIDETDSALFTMFDRDAFTLLGRSCADLIEHINEVLI